MCPLLGLLVRPFAGDFNTHWPDSWRHNFNFGFITGWLLSFISSSKRLPLKVKSRGLLLCFFFFFCCWHPDSLSMLWLRILECGIGIFKLNHKTHHEVRGGSIFMTKRLQLSLHCVSLFRLLRLRFGQVVGHIRLQVSVTIRQRLGLVAIPTIAPRVSPNCDCVSWSALKDNRQRSGCSAISTIYLFLKPTKRECLLNIVLIFSSCYCHGPGIKLHPAAMRTLPFLVSVWNSGIYFQC